MERLISPQSGFMKWYQLRLVTYYYNQLIASIQIELI